jgi:hypothetical protein
MNTYDSFESFRHGLVVSKLWLCEELEPIINSLYQKPVSVHVLGSWTNLLSFMMIVRNRKLYKEFHGYDIDESCKSISDKICDAWLYENPKVYNYTCNADNLDYFSKDPLLIINCSVDQMETNIWYDNIPKGSLVCLQTTDVLDENFPWLIKQKSPDIGAFQNRYKLSNTYYTGSKRIEYATWGYNRFMLIGIK